MGFRITWLDAPNRFATSAPAERRETLSAALGAMAGEPYAANTFPLKPDGRFTVLTIHASVTEEGFVHFAPQVVEAFNALAKELAGRFTDEERAALQTIIRNYFEVGSAYGASDEAMAVVVPERLIAEAKDRIDEAFSVVEEPLVIG